MNLVRLSGGFCSMRVWRISSSRRIGISALPLARGGRRLSACSVRTWCRVLVSFCGMSWSFNLIVGEFWWCRVGGF